VEICQIAVVDFPARTARVGSDLIPAAGPFLEIRRREARARKSLSVMFYELPPQMRARYGQLDQTCRAIREN